MSSCHIFQPFERKILKRQIVVGFATGLMVSLKSKLAI